MPSVAALRERVRGWLHREPKPVVPRTILIVDGNASNRQSTARLIESLGYQPLHSSGLAEATRHLEEQDPEFVLLAFELADSTGLEALSQIRQLDAELRVIMLTPDLWDARAAEAMRQGAIAYLPKPFGPDDLRELFGRR